MDTLPACPRALLLVFTDPPRPPRAWTLQVLCIHHPHSLLGAYSFPSSGSGDSRTSTALFLPQKNHTGDGVGHRQGRKHL